MTDSKSPPAPLRTVRGRYSIPTKPPAPPADDEKRELLANALGRLTSAMEDREEAGAALMAGLRQGRIKGWSWSRITFVPLQSDFWVAAPEEVANRLKNSRARWLSLSEEWLFVDRVAIDAMVRRASKVADATPFVFERDKARWPLFEACVWVATKGLDTTNDKVAAENLDDTGAVELFERLSDQPLIGGKYVYGRLPNLGTRIQVMAGDWDGAHTGWSNEGPEIMFRHAEDKKPGHERQYIAADMHKHRQLGPHLVDLWIARDDLFALFPEFASAQSGNLGKPVAEVAASVHAVEPVAKAEMPTELVDRIAGAGRKAGNIMAAAWALWEGSWPRTLSVTERNAQVWDRLIETDWPDNDPIGKDTWIEAFKRYDEIFPR